MDAGFEFQRGEGSKAVKTILGLFLIPLILTFSRASFAQPGPITPAPITPAPITPGTPTGSERPKIKSITGQVVSVDSKAGKLTVKARDRDVSFTTETKAAKSSLRKLKAGNRVRVSYTEENGKFGAQSVMKVK